MDNTSYQLFPPEDSRVNVFQWPLVILKHLRWPQGTVYMGPLILPNVQESAPLLSQEHIGHEWQGKIIQCNTVAKDSGLTLVFSSP